MAILLNLVKINAFSNWGNLYLWNILKWMLNFVPIENLSQKLTVSFTLHVPDSATRSEQQVSIRPTGGCTEGSSSPRHDSRGVS